MNVLTVNCGSSSLKVDVLTVDARGRVSDRPARGRVERVGGDARVRFEAGEARDEGQERVAGHAEAVETALAWLAKCGIPFDAVCHRVVHGGARFTAPTVIDASVIAGLDALVELAPLHNAPAVAAIRAVASHASGRRPNVAVFDTAFHASLPLHARMYAIPRDLAERHGIRRYGFHGLAYQSVVERYAALAGVPVTRVNVVGLHLGSGCSAVAIAGGQSIDTSMGFTPLEGLVMGTRSGDVDPALVAFLARAEGVDADVVTRWLQEDSGLQGLGGRHDIRDLLAREASDPHARLAIDVFCHRARKYVGAYLAAVRDADAVVVSGGIGEHQPAIRARILGGFDWAGLRLDEAANAIAVTGDAARISTEASRLGAFVVPADEEAVMARAAVSALGL